MGGWRGAWDRLGKRVFEEPTEGKAAGGGEESDEGGRRGVGGCKRVDEDEEEEKKRESKGRWEEDWVVGSDDANRSGWMGRDDSKTARFSGTHHPTPRYH